MAHADYNCCAVCDWKLEYAGFDSQTKKRICESCLVNLQKENINAVTVEQLIEWIKKTDKKEVEQKLKKVGFSHCCYPSEVDEQLTKLMIAV